jgi:chemotaxis protein methyltransferase WspC
VVSESWFFRDNKPFYWLEDHVQQRMLREASNASFRILSLGCASGEEPYSIAMTLLNAGLKAHRFKMRLMLVSVG